MLKKLLEKIKEAVFSVLPVTLIVIILNFTPLIELTTSDVVTYLTEREDLDIAWRT